MSKIVSTTNKSFFKNNSKYQNQILKNNSFLKKNIQYQHQPYKNDSFLKKKGIYQSHINELYKNRTNLKYFSNKQHTASCTKKEKCTLQKTDIKFMIDWVDNKSLRQTENISNKSMCDKSIPDDLIEINKPKYIKMLSHVQKNVNNLICVVAYIFAIGLICMLYPIISILSSR